MNPYPPRISNSRKMQRRVIRKGLLSCMLSIDFNSEKERTEFLLRYLINQRL